MPKLKTHKGTSKRIRVTKTGKLMRRNAATHHKLHNQTASRKRAKSIDSQIGHSIKKVIRRAVGL